MLTESVSGETNADRKDFNGNVGDIRSRVSPVIFRSGKYLVPDARWSCVYTLRRLTHGSFTSV
jgi:hypothetical protein